MADEETCLLFVYGMLQPHCRPPRTIRRHWPDRIRGDLYDLGSYPGVIRLDQSDRWVPGSVLEINVAELAAIDAFEEVDEGVYRRRTTETEKGIVVWVYEYLLPLALDHKLISQWPVDPPPAH